MTIFSISLQQFEDLQPGDEVIIHSVIAGGRRARVSRWPDGQAKTRLYVRKWNETRRAWQQERLVKRQDIRQIIRAPAREEAL